MSFISWHSLVKESFPSCPLFPALRNVVFGWVAICPDGVVHWEQGEKILVRRWPSIPVPNKPSYPCSRIPDPLSCISSRRDGKELVFCTGKHEGTQPDFTGGVCLREDHIGLGSSALSGHRPCLQSWGLGRALWYHWSGRDPGIRSLGSSPEDSSSVQA